MADFNRDGHPDYVLQNANTGRTAIWYLNNNVVTRGAFWSDSAACIDVITNELGFGCSELAGWGRMSGGED